MWVAIEKWQCMKVENYNKTIDITFTRIFEIWSFEIHD